MPIANPTTKNIIPTYIRGMIFLFFFNIAIMSELSCVIFNQTFHWGLENYTHFHTEHFGNLGNDILEIIPDGAHAIELVRLVIRIMADNISEKEHKGLNYHIIKVRIFGHVFPDERGKLCAISVRERLGINLVYKFIPVLS